MIIALKSGYIYNIYNLYEIREFIDRFCFECSFGKHERRKDVWIMKNSILTMDYRITL